MNFRRGKQMIVMDTGLQHLSGSRMSTAVLTPPVAYRRWVVHPHNSINYILNGVAQVAHATAGGLDAAHFMGHGSPGAIHLGRERLSEHHADLFEMLRGKVGTIAFFSCQVGGEHQGGGWHRGHRTTLGQRIARASGAQVVVAQQIQLYHVRNNEIDWGEWEGPVDVYAGHTISTYQAPNPFRIEPAFNLERIIFG